MTSRRHLQKGLTSILVAGAFGVAAVLAFTSAAPAQARRAQGNVGGRPAVAGEVLVKFRDAATTDDRRLVVEQLDVDRDGEIGGSGIRHVHSRSRTVDDLVASLEANPAVEYAEPNYIVQSISVPNDPQFNQQWALQNSTWGGDIDATAAWDVSTGSAATVVAVVDTGTDYNHEDLAANMWTAPSAFTVVIGGMSITCPAGSHGFNALTNVCDPGDDNSHGTHTAGTIGAVGNNGIGVTGVSQTTRLMPLKFLDASGSGSISNAVNAIEFAIQAKKALGAAANVRVLSNSWGGGGFSQTLLDEINKAANSNMLFVAAAGNNNSNNDVAPFYPASFTAPNIISVAASDSNDVRASFSNYGAASVDLAAPGVNILSTTPGNSYQVMSGTSMATPHVAGAAALVLSYCALDTAGLKNTLLSTVDPLAAFLNLTTSGGRLNVNTAIHNCVSAPPPAPAAPTALTATAGNAQVTLSWTAVSDASSYVVKRGTSSGAEAVIASGVSTAGFVDSSAVNGTKYYYVVAAVNASGTSPNSNEASATPTQPVAPAAPKNLTASAQPKKNSLAWNASTGASSYKVLRSLTSGGPYTPIASGLTSTKLQDGAVVRGTTYFYVVVASNAVGSSDYSSQASATAK